MLCMLAYVMLYFLRKKYVNRVTPLFPMPLTKKNSKSPFLRMYFMIHLS